MLDIGFLRLKIRNYFWRNEMAIHDGHRERLRKKFRHSEVEDHELLELFLFATLPRINTNETIETGTPTVKP